MFSATIDYIATDDMSVSYTWILMVTGWLVPNFIIMSSHLCIIGLYRFVQSLSFHNDEVNCYHKSVKLFTFLDTIHVAQNCKTFNQTETLLFILLRKSEKMTHLLVSEKSKLSRKNIRDINDKTFR